MGDSAVMQVLQRVRHDRHRLPSGRARPAQRLPGCGQVINPCRRQRRPSRLRRPTLDCCGAGDASGEAKAGAAADGVTVSTEAQRQLAHAGRQGSSSSNPSMACPQWQVAGLRRRGLPVCLLRRQCIAWLTLAAANSMHYFTN